MKRNTNFIGYPIVIILTALITYFCFNKEPIVDPPVNEDIIEAELLYTPTGKPKEIIPLCKAQRLYNNFDSLASVINKYENRHSKDSILVSREITFNYQELVNYFNFIEQITDKAGEEINGLRFYLGQYKERNLKYPNQQMLFFNPTIIKKGKEFAYAIKNNKRKPEIVIIDNIGTFDCENPDRTSKYQEASILPFSNLSSYQEIISLQEQGGQIRPPDTN